MAELQAADLRRAFREVPREQLDAHSGVHIDVRPNGPKRPSAATKTRPISYKCNCLLVMQL